MSREKRARFVSLVLAGIAVLFLIAGVILALTTSLPPSHWKTAEATVLQSTIIREHDARGVLQFKLQLDLKFDAEGRPQTTTAVSDYSSGSFAFMMKKLEDYGSGSTHRILYKPDDPKQVRFETGFTWQHVRRGVFLAGLALLFALFSLIAIWFTRPGRDCPECGEELKSYYRFCPICSASVSTKEHRKLK
jgi:hypothetical protein